MVSGFTKFKERFQGFENQYVIIGGTACALTIPQQKAFMDYLKAHREYQGWVPIITVLLGTGMRIGECIGLRWDDLDFEKRIISVNHTFIYRPDENRKSVKHISTPKTISGRRTILMIDEVFNAFLDEYEIQFCFSQPQLLALRVEMKILWLQYGYVLVPHVFAGVRLIRKRKTIQMINNFLLVLLTNRN